MISSVLALSILATSPATAPTQSDAVSEPSALDQKNLLSTEPLPMFATLFSLELEHAVSSGATLYLGAQGSPVFSAAGAGIGGRYYLKGRALHGAYLDLHADYFKSEHLLVDSYEKAGVGALFGMNHSFGASRWMMSWGVGAEVAHVEETDTHLEAGLGCGISICYPGIGATTTTDSGTRLLPNVRAALGYAF